jgi:hypothetical protein
MQHRLRLSIMTINKHFKVDNHEQTKQTWNGEAAQAAASARLLFMQRPKIKLDQPLD